MRSAVVLVSLIASIAAEAPYHLPRPASHAPAFNYQPGPSLAQSLPPVRPQPPPPASQPNLVQGSGYYYQQPNIQPAFVQPAPQLQYQPAPQSQYQPAPQTQYQPVLQPLPVYQPVPVLAPQPLPVSYPNNFPSTSYGIPQPRLQAFSLQPHPTYISTQLQSLPQPQFQPQPVSYFQKQQSQQGNSYAPPLSQSIQIGASLPLQSQALSTSGGSSSLSSYQADSNLYSGAQVHREALDSIVLDRVQSIIKENEHSIARDAGYLSLVSGVSLENAKPSVEISSFVQTTPVHTQSVQSSASSSSSISGESSAPSAGYGLPIITANSQSSQSVST